MRFELLLAPAIAAVHASPIHFLPTHFCMRLRLAFDFRFPGQVLASNSGFTVSAIGAFARVPLCSSLALHFSWHSVKLAQVLFLRIHARGWRLGSQQLTAQMPLHSSQQAILEWSCRCLTPSKPLGRV